MIWMNSYRIAFTDCGQGDEPRYPDVQHALSVSVGARNFYYTQRL